MLFPADPADQSQDEWERWALASPTAVTAQMVSAAGASIMWRDKVCQKAGYVTGEETVAREG
jgi:hypothetical protein